MHLPGRSIPTARCDAHLHITAATKPVGLVRPDGSERNPDRVARSARSTDEADPIIERRRSPPEPEPWTSHLEPGPVPAPAFPDTRDPRGPSRPPSPRSRRRPISRSIRSLASVPIGPTPNPRPFRSGSVPSGRSIPSWTSWPRCRPGARAAGGMVRHPGGHRAWSRGRSPRARLMDAPAGGGPARGRMVGSSRRSRAGRESAAWPAAPPEGMTRVHDASSIVVPGPSTRDPGGRAAPDAPASPMILPSAEDQGNQPVSNQKSLACARRSPLRSRATIVALPIGVAPIRCFRSPDHRKCRFQRCRRG